MRPMPSRRQRQFRARKIHIRTPAPLRLADNIRANVLIGGFAKIYLAMIFSVIGLDGGAQRLDFSGALSCGAGTPQPSRTGSCAWIFPSARNTPFWR